METKSRYEVLAELEAKKREYMIAKANIDKVVKEKERDIKELKRNLEDQEEDLDDYKSRIEDEKKNYDDLIKSVEESLKRFTLQSQKK